MQKDILFFQKGSIRWVIIIIIALLVASYFFNFDIQDLIQNPHVQSNFTYIWGKIVVFWNTYLESAFVYLWNDIFIDIVWAKFVLFLQSL